MNEYKDADWGGIALMLFMASPLIFFSIVVGMMIIEYKLSKLVAKIKQRYGIGGTR